MTTTLQQISWFPLNGLDNTTAPHRVTWDCASDLLNIEIIDGNIKKRDGYEKLVTTQISATASVIGQSGLDLSNGTSYDLFHLNTGKIVKLETNVASADIIKGFTTGENIYATQLLDELIVGQGVTALRTWDGTVTGIITASPFGKYMTTHLEKLWVAGISGNLSLVSCSATGDTKTWSGTGTADINVSQNDGTNVTGMAVLRGDLIIFKERSIWKLVGTTAATVQLYNIAQNVGCIEHRTIKNTGDMLLFAWVDGIYAFDGSSVSKLSWFQDDTWNTINRTQYDMVDAEVFPGNKEYIISFPVGSATTNTKTLVYYYDRLWKTQDGRTHAPAVLWTGVNMASLRRSRVGSTKTDILYVGDYTGYVKKRTTAKSDDGTAINTYIDSPFAASTGVSTTINLRRAFLPFYKNSGTISAQWSTTDDSTSWTTARVINLSGGGDALGTTFQIGVSAIGSPGDESTIVRTNFNGVQERRLKIRLTSNDALRTWKLENPVELWWKPRGHKDG